MLDGLCPTRRDSLPVNWRNVRQQRKALYGTVSNRLHRAKPVGHPHTDAHIVNVGTGSDANKADKKWTLDEVLHAMDQGHTFITKCDQSGKNYIGGEVYSPCWRTYIRSTPDRVDNSLDSLRRCNWEWNDLAARNNAGLSSNWITVTIQAGCRPPTLNIKRHAT